MNQVDQDFFVGISEGKIEKIEKALINGADPFLKYGRVDALTLAANKNKLDVFEYLLSVTKGGKELERNGEIGTETLLTSLLRDPSIEHTYAMLLIESGVDVNKLNKNLNSPLIIAIEFEKTEIAKALIKAGADVNYAVPEINITPYLTAARNGNKEIIKELLSSGVSANQTNLVGENILNMLFVSDLARGNKKQKAELLEIVDFLIKNGVNVNNTAKSGLTPLFSAKYFPEGIDLLVKNGADIFMEHEHNLEKKQSFAHHFLTIPVLGSMPNPLNKQENIIVENAPLTREVLFDNFKYNFKNGYGNTLEGLLSLNYPKEISEDLSNKYLNVFKNSDLNQFIYSQTNAKTEKVNKCPIISQIIMTFENDFTSELVDSKLNDGEKFSLLLNESDMSINVQPLIALIRKGNLELLRKIANDSKFDPSTINIPIGKKNFLTSSELLPELVTIPKLEKLKGELAFNNSLLMAIEENKKNKVESEFVNDKTEGQLLKKKEQQEISISTLEKLQIEVANTLKYIKFDFNAMENGVPNIFHVNTVSTINLYEKMGAKITDVAENGDNILVNAILKGKLELVEYLFDKLKDNAEMMNNTWNQLAYHDLGGRVTQTFVENSLSIIRKYCEKNNIETIPYINEKDDLGNTFLMTALANDYPYLASILIDMKADINVTNNEGESPIMYAISIESEGIIKKLLANNVDLNTKTNEGITLDVLVEDLEDNFLKKYLENELEQHKNSNNTSKPKM